MSLTKKLGLGKPGIPVLAAASILFVLIAAAGGYAAESDPGNRAFSASLDLPQWLSVIQQSPLIASGVRLGTVVVYDDPATRRPADYLELYDGDGGLVAVSWFDRFGIQRVAVDRAFVDGEERLAGVFVAVVDDDFI
jgi:hypothetical protein